MNTPVVNQSVEINLTRQTTSSSLKLLILFLITLTLGGFWGYLAGSYKNILFQKQNNYLTNIVPTAIPSSISNTDPTANWKTYINKDYRFEFEYPPNWNDQVAKYNNVDIISRLGEEFSGTEPGDPIPLTFVVSLSLGERPITTDQESKIINSENIFIDNSNYQLKTYRRFEVEGSEEISDIIEIPRQGKTLYLNFSHVTDGCLWNETSYPKEKCLNWNQEKLIEYRNLRNQILSTFRFLGESKISELWKPICNTQKIENIDIKVDTGDGITNIARKAVNSYVTMVTLNEIPKATFFLTPEEKVYAEDFVRKSMGNQTLVIGSTINISCQIVEEGAIKSRMLTLSEKGNLEQYSKDVVDLQEKEWFRQIIEESMKNSTLKPAIININ